MFNSFKNKYNYALVLAVSYLGPILVSAQGLRNPLGDVDSLEEVLVALLNAFIVIAIPIIVFVIVYSGFLYVSARGNAEQIKKATTSLTYAIIGAVLILGAVVLSEILANIVRSFEA